MNSIVMPDKTQSKPDLQRLADAAQAVSLPEWVKSMTDHYLSTGSFRQQDVRKVLGDPKKGIQVGSDVSLSSMMQSRSS
jgi:hypothetical protein